MVIEHRAQLNMRLSLAASLMEMEEIEEIISQFTIRYTYKERNKRGKKRELEEDQKGTSQKYISVKEGGFIREDTQDTKVFVEDEVKRALRDRVKQKRKEADEDSFLRLCQKYRSVK